LLLDAKLSGTLLLLSRGSPAAAGPRPHHSACCPRPCPCCCCCRCSSATASSSPLSRESLLCSDSPSSTARSSWPRSPPELRRDRIQLKHVSSSAGATRQLSSTLPGARCLRLLLLSPGRRGMTSQ
jgi:hypothetical protein